LDFLNTSVLDSFLIIQSWRHGGANMRTTEPSTVVFCWRTRWDMNWWSSVLVPLCWTSE